MKALLKMTGILNKLLSWHCLYRHISPSVDNGQSLIAQLQATTSGNTAFDICLIHFCTSQEEFGHQRNLDQILTLEIKFKKKDNRHRISAQEHTDWAVVIIHHFLSPVFRNTWNNYKGQCLSAICSLIINFQILARRGVLLTVLL